MRKERQSAIALASESTRQPDFLDVPSLVLNRAHPLSDLIYKHATYKVYWGGRGSAKSWGIAEALIRKAASEKIRILCTREFQVSIKDSSHKLLVDTIERLGLNGWFTVTAMSITSRSGAEFIFKGLHNNEQGIKSTEGIDITWVEEAQTVSAGSWRTLPATVLRNDDCEIWVSFNMITEQDATYRRFVNEDGTARRRNSIVHKLNYDSNPYFGGKLREEMEEDRENDYDLYEHVWLGMPLRKSNAIIFNGKVRVEEFPDELEKEADRLYYGADFGFANDPNTLTRSFIIPAGADRPYSKGTLYVTHAAFGWHVDLDDMPEFYDEVPGSRDWPIKADAARPETISHLRRRGFNVSAAEKWDGCVKDGITHIRGFDAVIIHPRCKGSAERPGLAEEAYLYRYKVDKLQVDEKGQPLVLPIVVDKHNHGWDGIRYSLDGHIQRSGELGMWERLSRQA